MIENLQVKVKTLAAEASFIRKQEEKQQRIKNFEAQVQLKRHQKDAPKPVPRVYPDPKENSQEIYNEAHDKFWNLHHHRTNKLRKEARISHLAYAFLRGVPYKTVETKTHDVLNTFEDLHKDTDDRLKERRIFDKVKAMAKKCHGQDIRDFQQKWAEWIDDARKYIAAQKG